MIPLYGKYYLDLDNESGSTRLHIVYNTNDCIACGYLIKINEWGLQYFKGISDEVGFELGDNCNLIIDGVDIL